ELLAVRVAVAPATGDEPPVTARDGRVGARRHVRRSDRRHCDRDRQPLAGRADRARARRGARAARGRHDHRHDDVGHGRGTDHRHHRARRDARRVRRPGPAGVRPLPRGSEERGGPPPAAGRDRCGGLRAVDDDPAEHGLRRARSGDLVPGEGHGGGGGGRAPGGGGRRSGQEGRRRRQL
ncbi:MAG: hypothetical protein AVDCRST_MAG07-1058, partial [uncultured Frankineae bacterium]